MPRRQHPDDDDHGDEEADLAGQLALPGGHRRLDEAEDHARRRGANEDVCSAATTVTKASDDECWPIVGTSVMVGA